MGRDLPSTGQGAFQWRSPKKAFKRSTYLERKLREPAKSVLARPERPRREMSLASKSRDLSYKSRLCVYLLCDLKELT